MTDSINETSQKTTPGNDNQTVVATDGFPDNPADLVGQKRFVYIAPNALVEESPLPVFEATVVGFARSQRVGYGKGNDENSVAYLCDLSGEHFAYGQTTVRAEHLFPDRGSALIYARGEIERVINNLRKRIEERSLSLEKINGALTDLETSRAATNE